MVLIWMNKIQINQREILNENFTIQCLLILLDRTWDMSIFKENNHRRKSKCTFDENRLFNRWCFRCISGEKKKRRICFGFQCTLQRKIKKRKHRTWKQSVSFKPNKGKRRISLKMAGKTDHWSKMRMNVSMWWSNRGIFIDP